MSTISNTVTGKEHAFVGVAEDGIGTHGTARPPPGPEVSAVPVLVCTVSAPRARVCVVMPRTGLAYSVPVAPRPAPAG